jgi:hypothetical protein
MRQAAFDLRDTLRAISALSPHVANETGKCRIAVMWKPGKCSRVAFATREMR